MGYFGGHYDILYSMNARDINLPLPLEELRRVLRRSGVRSAAVFGSYARGEAAQGSDLDLLVELEPGSTYLELGGAQYELENTYGVHVDFATQLHPLFAPHIKPELVAVL